MRRAWRLPGGSGQGGLHPVPLAAGLLERLAVRRPPLAVLTLQPAERSSGTDPDGPGRTLATRGARTDADGTALRERISTHRSSPPRLTPELSKIKKTY